MMNIVHAYHIWSQIHSTISIYDFMLTSITHMPRFARRRESLPFMRTNLFYYNHFYVLNHTHALLRSATNRLPIMLTNIFIFFYYAY